MNNNLIKVLLVEDNPGDVRLVREMLSESDLSGFVLEHADRISAGLERLSRKDIDVVLLDLSLPDSQGLDTLQNVFLAAPEVPIVVIHNLDDEKLALQAVKVGAQDYIVKGYMDTHALTRAIRYAIERKRSEEELRRVNRTLKTLSDCNQALVRATDEASLLHEICKTLVTTGRYRMAWVGYAERDEAKTVRQVACAGYEEGYLAALNITWADTESGRGPTGTAIRTGKICKAINILTNPSFTPWRSNALERGYAASIALPLIGNGGPFGALNIYAQEADAFDEQEERLLRELADDLAYGILALRTHSERALAVESLQKSEEQYRLLFNTMLNGFALHEIICDENGKPCDYRFLEINPAFERMTGLKAAEIIGKTVLQVLPGTEAYWISTYGEVALTGKSTRFENYAQALKKYFDVLAFRPRKNQFATLFTDVTERRKAEKVQEAVYKISQTSVSTGSLKELYGSIHGILAELMPVDNFYIALYDPTSDLLSFPYFVDQYDQPTPPQKPGHGLTEYIIRTGSTLLASPEIFTQLVQLGEVELVGTDSVDWLGVPLKAGGRVIGVLVTQSYTEGIRFRQEEKDLLEFVSTQVALAIDRKRAEETLRESEERYRILVENTPDFIYSLDREGRYTAANQSVCQAMNLPLKAIIGKNHKELGFPGAIVQEWEGMNRRVLWDGEVVQAETSTPMPDGKAQTHEVMLRPIKDLNGQITGIRGVSHDISEHKRIEDALRTSEERFRILFEDSPISLWEEDFSGVKRYLEELQRQGVKDIQALLESHPEQVNECVKQIRILDVNKATLRLYQAENKADILDHSEKILSANSYETIGDELVGILQGKTKFDKEVVDQTLAGDKIMIRLGWTAAPGQEDALSRVIVSKIDITERKRAEEAVQQAKEFAENVIQTANAIFVQLDMVGNVQKLNSAAEEITGFNRKEVEGKNWFEILVPRDRYPYVWEEYIRLTERGEVPEIFENPILTKHGEERHVLWKNSVLYEGDKIVGTISFGIDITERKQAEEKNQRQLDRLTALSEIDHAINSSLDMRLTLNTILAQIAAQLGIDAVALLLLDPHKQVLEYIDGRGFRTETLQHTYLRLGDSYAGRAALGRQIVRISDLQAHKTDFLRSPTFSQEGFVCYFGVPLIAKGEVKGVLEIFHRSALNPDTEWLDFMETLAGQAAIAIDNAQLFDNLQRSNLELMQAYDATIEGWSQAMDLRDKETEGHTLRVTELTVRLARAIGLSEDEIVYVRRGALLHDMGKLGVPDAILFKPGKLTNEEWALMVQHPQFAYNMLSPIAYLRPALDIPYCHHEKWDGTGYPRGLKGEQIPLAARIFAVADVWDALTSDRPYRKAWKETEALEYIRNQSGWHFDPKVVEIFLWIKPWMPKS